MDPRSLGQDRHTSNGQSVFQQHVEGAIVDDDMTRQEDTNLKKHHEANRAQSSMDDEKLPLRPGYGDRGQPVKLWTNYLKVSMDDAQKLFTYEAAIDQRLLRKHQRCHFMETAMKKIPELSCLGAGIATDYASLVVTSSKLLLGPKATRTFAMEYYDTDFSEGRVYAKNRPFELTLSLVRTISSSDVSSYIMSGPASSIDPVESGPADVDAVRILNIVMASHPHKDPGVYQGGQNKFFRYPEGQDSYPKYDLLGGLIAVRGYYSSIRSSTSRVLLNLNAQCSPFYKSINARELMQLFRALAPGDWVALESFLKGLQVETTYMKASDGASVSKARFVVGLSHKKIHHAGSKEVSGNAEVDHGNANEIKFKRSDGPSGIPISVQEYFHAAYDITLSHPTEYVLNCGRRDHPVWIPPELCKVMPGQPYRGQLNDAQLARMITIAARPPAENASRIMAEDGGLGLIGVLPTTCDSLNAFGVTVDPKMIGVPGRVLAAPKVMYSGNSTASTVLGSWNMREKKVSRSATFSDWTILRVGAAAAIGNLEQHCKALTAGFRSCGLNVNKPSFFPGPTIPALTATKREEVILEKAAIDSKLHDIFELCKAKNVTMLLVILPSTKPWIRERVKYWGDTKYGVHSTCVQMDKIRRQDLSYSANVALKVNLKLGGSNQYISPADLGFLGRGTTMLVGIDVTHPAPGTVKGIPSIAGVVSNIDATFSQWPGNICCQESKKEMVSELDVLIEERLTSWVSHNPGRKLENIVVYRDGVSESQYTAVRSVEIPAVRTACEKVFKDAEHPKITFLVVGKNHHTRFFPTSIEKADRKHNCNIKNGTVVDRGITMQKGWDFYMAAHSALQGTTKPAHYVVLLDEIKDTKKLNANDLEKMTHNLCYLQGRATKAVSVCPPAYYAHLICLRARCYLADYISRNAGREFNWNEAPWRSGVHESLKDSMFYI